MNAGADDGEVVACVKPLILVVDDEPMLPAFDRTPGNRGVN